MDIQGMIDKSCERRAMERRLIYLEDAYNALVAKGQESPRYKIGEKWELNGNEIRDALEDVRDATPDLLHEVDYLNHEIQFWREKARAYETAIVILAKRIKDDKSA